MEEHADLARQVLRLQRRVNLLTAAVLGTLVVAVVSGARTLPSDVFEAETVHAKNIQTTSIVIRGAESDSDSIRLSAGKAGAHLFFRDTADKNQVELRKNGFTLKDTNGGHSLHLGLSPGPKERRAPFLLLRDRNGDERFSLGLHAENDSPQLRMQGDDEQQATLELAPNSVFAHSRKGATRARLAIVDGTPELQLRQSDQGKPLKSIVLTPDTKLPQE